MLRTFLFLPVLLAVCLLLGSWSNSVAGSADGEDFFATRKVVGAVEFSVGSTELSQSAKNELDKLVQQLRQVDPEQTVIRLEGFSSPEGSEVANVELSMQRAMVVENYFRAVHHLPMTRYLVGLGVVPDTTLRLQAQRRVEIVFYDNLLNMENAEVDKLTIDGKRN